MMFTAANKFIGVSRDIAPPISMGDPYWDQTSVLMHMDSGAFPDVKNHTTSIVGTVTLDTTIKKFGTGSARHPGGTGNALEIQNNQGFNFGSDDFTIEAQLYVEALGTNGAI